jgi:hypothetical protein
VATGPDPIGRASTPCGRSDASRARPPASVRAARRIRVAWRRPACSPEASRCPVRSP